MSLMMPHDAGDGPDPFDLPLGVRVQMLHEQVRGAPPALCVERALGVTEWFRDQNDPVEPMVVQKAGALAHVLGNIGVRIHPGELLVGCFTSHRVGGVLFPELHGLAMLEDLFAFERRAVNPLRVSWGDRAQLLRAVVPYWAPRLLPLRAFGRLRGLRFISEQLDPLFYLINETGGVSHFVPSYEGLLRRGTSGFRAEAKERLAKVPPGSESADVLRAMRIACKGLEAFAHRYRKEAESQAARETDPTRQRELSRIAETCARVPRHPARTFEEALQCILFAQIALNLESLDNAVSPGRLDQILWAHYRRDLAEGRLDREGAFELLGCFAVKLCEIVPVFSRRITRFHGGLFNGQVVVVGGTDRDGQDSTNELTHVFVTLMDRLRTRQPNYHARLHRGTPSELRTRIAAVLSRGAASPALYNDEVIVPILRSRGVSEADARDYANVGCVEPVPAGSAFFSTDAALMNLPLCLELALNRGRRFGRRRRIGVKTPDLSRATGIDEIFAAFEAQLRHALGRLLRELRAIEEANAKFHPTPLTSTLLDGCMAAGRDATSGGARYNGSGVQGVGAVEVGDSLAALEHVVFRGHHATMADVIRGCAKGFEGDEILRTRLCGAPKHGDDDADADQLLGRVMELLARLLEEQTNSRGGQYVAGFYSVTAHQAFGELVGALPSGRGRGEPFSSGLSPRAGGRWGPTAALRSAASLPLHCAKNGINYNLDLASWMGGGAEGGSIVQGLIDGAFDAGCMQMQVNVLDPAVLIEARDNPGKYPGLLVRVSGYSAYFDDLSPEMKQEIIDRFGDTLPPPNSS